MKELTGFPTKEQVRDLKRREIVRCAAERFGREGYENVPLDAIAADLGVTKAALYNYVTSKSDLLMQCYEVGMDRLIVAVEAAFNKSGTAAERLDAGLQAYIVTMTRKDMQYLWNYTRDLTTSGNKRSVQVSRDAIDTLIRKVLCEGIADGSLRTNLDPKLASLVILGAVNWVGIWFRENGTQKRTDIAREVVHETLYGYLATR